MNAFDRYQDAARATAVYPIGECVTYPALGLCGEAGEVAEKVKKVLRDNAGIFDPERRDPIAAELGDVLWYVANLASDLGLSLSDIAASNLQKLASRKKRGVLQGNGDER